MNETIPLANDLTHVPKSQMLAELARRNGVPDEPFPKEAMEHITQAVRNATRRRISQAHVLTADIGALHRWIMMHGLDVTTDRLWRRPARMTDNMWWGYRHTSGTVQAKRFFDDRAPIEDARQSTFVTQVVEPFQADSRDEALQIVRQRTTQDLTLKPFLERVRAAQELAEQLGRDVAWGTADFKALGDHIEQLEKIEVAARAVLTCALDAPMIDVMRNCAQLHRLLELPITG